ncbi:CAAX amino terminal protease [Kipferlia bialata]|uniref:intramembrane prenyl-peptidase Rce1 n=1 Tax=Kipferlia bialata TaxID=797122 RepID=A0A9K3CNX8_9EUKA|nr:CAAX amino terminal protease [Kipferlia bialata]|eukprot:g1590.t1
MSTAMVSSVREGVALMAEASVRDTGTDDGWVLWALSLAAPLCFVVSCLIGLLASTGGQTPLSRLAWGVGGSLVGLGLTVGGMYLLQCQGGMHLSSLSVLLDLLLSTPSATQLCVGVCATLSLLACTLIERCVTHRWWDLSPRALCHSYLSVLVAPLAEEITFRACPIACLTQLGLDPVSILLVLPAFFSLAHVVPIMRSYRAIPRPSLLTVIGKGMVKLVYTWGFGLFSSMLVLGTGSTGLAVLSHSICNALGIPNLGALQRRSHHTAARRVSSHQRTQTAKDTTCGTDSPMRVRYLSVYKVHQSVSLCLVGGALVGGVVLAGRLIRVL